MERPEGLIHDLVFPGRHGRNLRRSSSVPEDVSQFVRLTLIVAAVIVAAIVLLFLIKIAVIAAILAAIIIGAVFAARYARQHYRGPLPPRRF